MTKVIRRRPEPTERLRRLPESAAKTDKDETTPETASVHETVRHRPIPTETIPLQEESQTEAETAEDLAAEIMSENESAAEEENGLAQPDEEAASSETILKVADSKPTNAEPKHALGREMKGGKVNWTRANPKLPPRNDPITDQPSAEEPSQSPAADSTNPLNRPLFKPSKQPTKPSRQEESDSSFLDTLRKPYVLGTLGIAAAVLILLGFRYFRSDHVRLYPAHGRATFEGQPMPGALIMLEPVGMKDPPFPQPRATVNDDGSFVLGTYGKGDGVPPGEYRATVLWMLKMTNKQEIEGGALPKNVLPTRYSKFDTSGLTVQIGEGDNDIPAFQLKR